jgi:hypothetical protein
MSTPVAPHSRAITTETLAEQAANEPVLPEHAPPPAPPAPTANAGWDPYEVWRTRVFTAQTKD